MNPTGRRAAILAIAVLTTVATLALATGVGATVPGRNGLIAFHADIGDAGPQIFTMRSNGKQVRQITHVDGVAAMPDWSPDGRQIAFTLNDCAIGMMDADGGNVHEVASDPGLCLSDASFTADGSRLVYIRFDPGLEIEQIWSMNVDGSDQRFVTDAGGPDPNVSPDGRRVSFKGPPDGALFVANIDGSDLRQISPSISVTYKHDWAPDGQHLVVSDNSDPGPDDAVNIVTVRPDGSDWRYLTHYPAGYRANVGGYSPDGKWIVFRLQGPGLVPTMYRIRPDGTGLHALFQSSTIVPRFIDWGPAVTRNG
ncbi:MAG: PD40 domain-containing protein [Chloroflexi bacterium]|nr:PD40 domain-containing protein [Chloroflexota bacterium]